MLTITFISRLMGIVRGGGETVDLNLGRALQRLGCDVRFLTGRRLSRLDLPVDGFPTTYVATPYLRFIHYHLDRAYRPFCYVGGWALRLDLWMFGRAARRALAGQARPDVFQLCGLPALACSLESALVVPCVVRWPGPPGPKLAAWRTSFSASVANGNALEQARRYDPEVREVPIGVDTSKFRPGDPAAKRRELGIAARDVIILFCGRLISVKNVAFLIRGFVKAAQIEPRLRLVLVGDGSEKNRLQRQVQEAGASKRVLFAGAQHYDAIVDYYQMGDIFALTSKYDNFPNVILEAMSCGLPIVATKVGGIPRQVEDGVNGFLLDSDDDEALTAVLVILGEDAGLRRDIGARNRAAVVERYDWASSARRLMGLYETLAQKRIPRSIGAPVSC